MCCMEMPVCGITFTDDFSFGINGPVYSLPFVVRSTLPDERFYLLVVLANLIGGGLCV
ncbi:hypothetical protein SAMN05661012_04691 [Chitinophaga sancti]|uniref:Uncharacterized protein n=1 Tax=Chitinophaga sancti TaxID=1004 RepID=A0A1K1S4F8_9BACT|nr:hypothetical protein SAMN05661012_04691 [Chitinophaga sancti]